MLINKIPSVTNCDPFQKIKESDVVSFDIFDTAIVRPFLHHHEMYHVVEKLIGNKRFFNSRIRAERNTRKSLIHQKQVKEEITISDIYEHIHIPNKEYTSEVELNFDVEICKRRQYTFKLYKFALNLNKRIVFTSDITYPRKTIEEILHKNGFTEYEKLYISSEEKLSKHQGGLYEKLIFELKVAPHRILHIGDSIKADIHMAKKHGIKPLYIPRPLHALEKVLNKKQFNITKNTINSALFACSANISCDSFATRKYVITFPMIYKLAVEIFKSHKDDSVFLINEGHGNGIFYLFADIYSHFGLKPIEFLEIDISQIYAASIRTFEDLQTLKQNISKENFQHILTVYFKTSAESVEELEKMWAEIEITALKIRKDVIDKCSFLVSQNVYDFTFHSLTKDFLQNLLNVHIPHYTQSHKLLAKTIEKTTSTSWLRKPNSLDIIEEMKSITNEEMQRFILPQSHTFFKTLGKYLHVIDKKTVDKTLEKKTLEKQTSADKQTAN